MPRRHKSRKDGSPAYRSVRTPKPPPPPESLAELEELTDNLPPDLRAYRDQGLLSPQRRYYLEQVLGHRTRTLATILAGTHDPHNQAAVMRTCESLGIQEVHLALGDETFRPSPKVTQNAHRWLDVVSHPDFAAVAGALRGRGFKIFAAKIEDRTESLYAIDFTRPVAVVFGSEPTGLPDNVLAACDGSFRIPMYGLSQSYNISVAAAIALSWAVESRRRAWRKPGDLDPEELVALRRRFYETAARGRS
ncbi:MAG: RNA methyltransferase, partial [Thermoanaerobaculia bacterium]